jgi:hypothetical protein
MPVFYKFNIKLYLNELKQSNICIKAFRRRFFNWNYYQQVFYNFSPGRYSIRFGCSGFLPDTTNYICSFFKKKPLSQYFYTLVAVFKST